MSCSLWKNIRDSETKERITNKICDTPSTKDRTSPEAHKILCPSSTTDPTIPITHSSPCIFDWLSREPRAATLLVRPSPPTISRMLPSVSQSQPVFFSQTIKGSLPRNPFAFPNRSLFYQKLQPTENDPRSAGIRQKSTNHSRKPSKKTAKLWLAAHKRPTALSDEFSQVCTLRAHFTNTKSMRPLDRSCAERIKWT